MEKKFESKYAKKYHFNFFAFKIMIYKYYYLFTEPSVIVSVLKVNFFQVSSIFSGVNNLDHFWMGGWGQKLYACQGWKFAHEIPLGWT